MIEDYAIRDESFNELQISVSSLALHIWALLWGTLTQDIRK